MAKDEYARLKDEEFTKLSIGLRRDMNENMAKERSNLRKALDTANAQERTAAIDRYVPHSLLSEPTMDTLQSSTKKCLEVLNT